MSKYFSVETTRTMNEEEAKMISYFTTNSVVKFADHISESVAFFSQQVQYDKRVHHISMLVRTGKDNKILFIESDENGMAVVISRG